MSRWVAVGVHRYFRMRLVSSFSESLERTVSTLSTSCCTRYEVSQHSFTSVSSEASSSIALRALASACAVLVCVSTLSDRMHLLSLLVLVNWIVQGRPANCEFIGYVKSPQPMSVEGCVANHDELMSNFFAQPVRPYTFTTSCYCATCSAMTYSRH